jgi:hypothetical protein
MNELCGNDNVPGATMKRAIRSSFLLLNLSSLSLLPSVFCASVTQYFVLLFSWMELTRGEWKREGPARELDLAQIQALV